MDRGKSHPSNFYLYYGGDYFDTDQNERADFEDYGGDYYIEYDYILDEWPRSQNK